MKSMLEKLLEVDETELKGLSFGLTIEDIADKHGSM